jgi:hypothetical protein
MSSKVEGLYKQQDEKNKFLQQTSIYNALVSETAELKSFVANK